MGGWEGGDAGDRQGSSCMTYDLFIEGSESQYCQKVCAKTGVHHKHRQVKATLQIHRPMSLGPISHICPMPPPIPPLNPRTLPSLPSHHCHMEGVEVATGQCLLRFDSTHSKGVTSVEFS